MMDQHKATREVFVGKQEKIEFKPDGEKGRGLYVTAENGKLVIHGDFSVLDRIEGYGSVLICIKGERRQVKRTDQSQPTHQRASNI